MLNGNVRALANESGVAKTGNGRLLDKLYRTYRAYRPYLLNGNVRTLAIEDGVAKTSFGRLLDRAYMMNKDTMETFLPPHGNYQAQLSYRKAVIVYDVTFRFCKRFLDRGDRTIDQMVQAARSGKQNIVEGSKAAKTSKEMEIKLMNVARASLEELLEDYRDYLRVRDFPIWDKTSKEARYSRKLGNNPDATYETFRELCETRPADVVANIALCLIHQANYLLDQQIRRLEQDFLREGGLRERMTQARLKARRRI